MVTGAQSLPPKANRGSSSAGLTAILAIAAVGAGLYFVSHRSQRRPRSEDDSLAQVAALARVEKETEWLQRAIRERRAILGMTYREVEMAKGPPHLKRRGDTLSEAHRAKGGVENWVYRPGNGEGANVLFGVNGRVIQSSDVGDMPRPGDAIRR